MSKWFEVNVITSRIYMVEVEDNEKNDDAEKAALNECHDGNSEIHECCEVKEPHIAGYKAGADEVLGL